MTALKNEYLIYTIAFLSVVIGSIILFKLTPIDKAPTQVQTEIARTAEQPAPVLEPESVVVAEPDAGQETDLATSIIPTAEADISEMPDIPYTDDEVLGFVFDADFDIAHDERGDIAGFRISSLPDEALEAVPPTRKLQNGDLITQINHVKLIDEESLVAALRNLYASQERSTITFIVERNGTSYSIPLEFQP